MAPLRSEISWSGSKLFEPWCLQKDMVDTNLSETSCALVKGPCAGPAQLPELGSPPTDERRGRLRWEDSALCAPHLSPPRTVRTIM